MELLDQRITALESRLGDLFTLLQERLPAKDATPSTPDSSGLPGDTAEDPPLTSIHLNLATPGPRREASSRRDSNLFTDLPQDLGNASYVENVPDIACYVLNRLSIRAFMKWTVDYHMFLAQHGNTAKKVSAFISAGVRTALLDAWGDPQYTELEFMKASYKDIVLMVMKTLQAKSYRDLLYSLHKDVDFPNAEKYKGKELEIRIYKRFHSDCLGYRSAFELVYNFHTTHNPNFENWKIRLENKKDTVIHTFLSKIPFLTYAETVAAEMAPSNTKYLRLKSFFAPFYEQLQKDLATAEGGIALQRKNIPIAREMGVMERAKSSLTAIFPDYDEEDWFWEQLTDANAKQELHVMSDSIPSDRGCTAMMLKGKCERAKCTYSHAEAALRKLFDEYWEILSQHRFRRFPANTPKVPQKLTNLAEEQGESDDDT